jgi:hypothetical protein
MPRTVRRDGRKAVAPRRTARLIRPSRHHQSRALTANIGSDSSARRVAGRRFGESATYSAKWIAIVELLVAEHNARLGHHAVGIDNADIN